MPSSIKMIKASNVFGSETAAKIETQIELEEELPYEETAPAPMQTEGESARSKKQILLKEAKTEALKIKQKAQKEMDQLQKAAKEEGFKKGQEEGFKEGLKQGLAEGLKQAHLQNEELKASILLMIKEAQAEVEAYQQDKREELIQLACHMAEKIVHDQIDHADEGILKLAKPFFYQLEKDEEFVTITVHPDQRTAVEERLHEIEAISPQTRFMVFSDAALEEKGLMIESSKAVVDLQIKKQLTAMLQEFEEMERTVDA